MDVRTTSILFALLSIVAMLGAGYGLVVFLSARGGAPWALRLRRTLAPHLLGATAAVTGTATLGSLYYSEIVGFEPCALCWYQRIFMYPMALLTTGALVAHIARRARGVPVTPAWWTVTPLAAVGLVIAGYHILIERIPAAEVTTCATSTPCTAILVLQLGFVSIPVMAAGGFAFALVASMLARAEARAPSQPDQTAPTPVDQDLPR